MSERLKALTAAFCIVFFCLVLLAFGLFAIEVATVFFGVAGAWIAAIVCSMFALAAIFWGTQKCDF